MMKKSLEGGSLFNNHGYFSKRLLCLVIFSLVLTRCVGSSSVSVIYLLPSDSDGIEVYTVSNFASSVQFPKGLPAQGSVTIRINGADVTSDFNDWGVSDTKIAQIDLSTLTGNKINSVQTPKVWAALRDGTNAFQVSRPDKTIAYFTMDMPSADIHITNVSDGYDGCGINREGCTFATLTFNNNVGNNEAVQVGKVDGSEFSTYVFKTTLTSDVINGVDVGIPGEVLIGATAADSRSNLLAAMTLGLGAKNGAGGIYGRGDDGFGKAVMKKDPRVIATQGSGNTIEVKGRKQGAAGEYDVTSSANTSWSSANLIEAPIKDGRPLHVEGFLEGEGYATIQSISIQISNVLTDGTLSPLAVNGAQMTANLGGVDGSVTAPYSLALNSDLSFSFDAYDLLADADAVTITITDSEGSSSKTWLRSNVPLYNQRLTNNGGISARIDSLTIFSVLYTVSTGLEEDGLGLTGTNLPEPTPEDPDPSRINVTEERVDGEVIIGLSLPVPGQDGAVPGQMDINFYMEELYFKGTTINLVDCDSATVITDVFADLYTIVNVNAAGDVTAITDTRAFSLPNMDVELQGGFLCSFAGLFVGALQGVIEGIVEGMIGDLISDIVAQIFNNDLPLLRLVVTKQGVNEYMSLAPVMAKITTSENTWAPASPGPDDVAIDATIGLFSRGTGGRPNASIGSLYTPAALSDATNSIDNSDAEFRTIGLNLSDNFVNQLFMGLWESGILYIDFNAGTGFPNPLIDDAIIQFASASPWEVDVVPSADPRGDLLIEIPDLLIGFQGDIHDPFNTSKVLHDDYVFLQVTMTINFAVNISADKAAGSLVISMASAPEFEVTSFSSDGIPVTTADVQKAVDFAINSIVTEMGDIEIPLPEVAGLTINMGDVWSDEDSLAMSLDIYNLDVFPGGVGDPSGYTLEEFTQNAQNNQHGYAVDTNNFVDSDFDWTSNWTFKEDTGGGFNRDHSDVDIGASDCPTTSGSGGNCLKLTCDAGGLFNGTCDNTEEEAYATRSFDINATQPFDKAILSLVYKCTEDYCGTVTVRGRNAADTGFVEVEAFTIKNGDFARNYNLMKLDNDYKTPGPLDLHNTAYPLEIKVGWKSTDDEVTSGAVLTVDDLSLKIYKDCTACAFPPL